MKIPNFSFLTDPSLMLLNTNTERTSFVKCHYERIENIVLQYNTLPSEDYNLNLKTIYVW